MKSFIAVLMTLILMLSSSAQPTQVYEEGDWSLHEMATLNKASGQKSRQGFAIYGNYLLQGYNQGEVNVYDISQMNQNGTAVGELNRVGNFTLGTNGHGMHVNTMSFSNQTLDGAAFPLLYVTGGDSATTDANGNTVQSGVRYDFCTVESISGRPGHYTSKTVQRIQLDNSFKKWFFFTWMVDGDYIYTFSSQYRTNGTKRAKDADNRYVITKFKRPAVAADGSTANVTLTADDIIEQKEYPYTVEYTQGGTFFDNTVLYCYGAGSTEFPNKLCAYSFETGKEVLEVDLGTVTKEIESCYVYNSTLYFNTQDGKLYSMDLRSQGSSRYYGATRYETSLAVSDLYKSKTVTDQYNCVVIACGADYPDALSGAYLANTKGAPVILMDNTNNDKVMNYLKEKVASDATVYVLGGSTALSTDVENQLKTAFPNTKRISGPTRYDTNLAVLKECGITGQDLMVCCGSNYADALSVSSLGKPVLLVDNTTGKLTDAQKEFLSENKPSNLYIIGGTTAVPTDLETQLTTTLNMNATRIAGQTRYETSQQVLNKFSTSTDNLVLAYGGNFPDALCAGPLAYYLKAPVLLTSESTAIPDDIKVNYANANIYAIGGEGSSDAPQLTDNAVKNIKPGKVIEYLYEADLQRK